jgi:hypothetical protein
LTVAAGSKCQNYKHFPECIAFYKKIGLQAQIWVRRKISNDIYFFNNSTEASVNLFVQGCTDFVNELILLSHEYGHFLLNHEGIIKRCTIDACFLDFEGELDAWEKGEEVLANLGFVDWQSFQILKDKSLKSYIEGFNGLFPGFRELVKMK